VQLELLVQMVPLVQQVLLEPQEQMVQLAQLD
jgi:hypothetical protein